jgi:hypothetical protein
VINHRWEIAVRNSSVKEQPARRKWRPGGSFSLEKKLRTGVIKWKIKNKRKNGPGMGKPSKMWLSHIGWNQWKVVDWKIMCLVKAFNQDPNRSYLNKLPGAGKDIL